MTWISTISGWYYMLVVAAYSLFALYVGLSRYSNIKLGQDHDKPDFPFITWAAMLFSAGIGIDLLFSGCPSRWRITSHRAWAKEPRLRPRYVRLRRHFALGPVHGWGIYALIGMTLAYFAYRHRLPLALRSALLPVFGKERTEGWLGHSVDTFGVVCTLLGIATSLGLGFCR